MDRLRRVFEHEKAIGITFRPDTRIRSREVRSISTDVPRPRRLLFLLHSHGHRRVGRKSNFIAFDVGDEALVDEVMMALVAATSAVLLCQLDAVAFDPIDHADMDTI